MLDWLKKLLKKEESTEIKSKHTMGPEELMDTDDEAVLTQEGESDAEDALDSSSVEKEPILEPPHETPGKNDAIRIMEAALFMGGKAMSIDELGKLANIPLLKAREYIPNLIEDFNRRPSALEIVEDVSGFRMKVRSPFDEKVSHLAGVSELNPAEMKTLAFIAYKQPLLQSQLVQVRSNTAYEHLQRIIEMGFVSREPKGRTYVLRTTKKFSEYFGTHALKLKPIQPNVDQTQSEELL